MSADCFLRVIRIEGLQWERKRFFGDEKPRLYVQVQLGNSTKKTREIKDTVEPWDELLILPQADTYKDVSIKLFHNPLIGRDVFLGSSDIQLSELSSNWEDATVLLTRTLEDNNAESLTLVVRLLNPSNLSSDIKNDVDAASSAMHRLGHAARPLDIMDQGVSALSGEEDLCKSFWDITTKLAVFVNFMDDVAKINPYLNAAWQVTSAVYKAAMHQRETDCKLADLVHAMKDAYDFVADAEGLPNKARRLQKIINELLEQTVKCCHFVLEYTKRDFIGRLLRMSRPKIDEFIEHFNKLKAALDSDIGLHNALISICTHAKVEDMSGKIDYIYLERQLKPSHMDAFARKTCLEGTRCEVLIEIADWIRSDTKQNVLWLRGVAGSGKSTIASTVVETCREASLLGAFLFFNRDTSTPDLRASVFRTIAFQLAQFNSSIARHVENAIKHNAHIVGAVAEVQFRELLSKPLNALKDKIQDPVVIVIEALDEYGSLEDRRSLMSILKHLFIDLPPNFRFLLTSRPEADIIAALSNREGSVYELVLDSGSEDSIRDVLHYIDHNMSRVFLDAELDKPTDWDAKLRRLAEASEGLFIWASTAVRLVSDDEDFSPRKRLEDIAKNSGLLKGLDQLYDSVLKNSGFGLERDQSPNSRLLQVLGLILLSKEPLTDSMIDGILGFSESNGNPSRLILSRLQSVLVFTPGNPIHFLHTSFADYLSTAPCSKPCSTHQQSHCPSWPRFVNTLSQKSFIAKRCFEIMKDELHFNMFNIESSFQLGKDESELEEFNENESYPEEFSEDISANRELIEDVPDLDVCSEPNISSHLGYACMYWAEHLLDIPYEPNEPDLHELMDELKTFAYDYLLYWLEVLSLLEKTSYYSHGSIASQALKDGATWSKLYNAYISSFLMDASKLTSAFATAMNQSTPQIYVSMIPLMKDESNVAAYYFQRMIAGVKVERIGTERAPLWLKVLEGHTSSVESVAVSPDGKCVASGSWGGIGIWDIQSGRIVRLPLEGHWESINSIAFSPDSQRIVSGSKDKTVRIWDSQSGEQVLGPLEGHSDVVISVAFSPSGTLVVSGSEDETIRVWDTGSGCTIKIIEGHSGFDGHGPVIFTPDGCCIVSCSWDKTIRVWDTETGSAIGEPFVGHEDPVWSVAVSSDGQRVVSGSWDHTVRVWDIESGKTINGPFPHSGPVKSVAFSPDGKRVVSGVGRTVVVWDVESGEIVCGPLIGHTDWVTSVAFTPDGRHIISGSEDHTVRIWDASISKVDLGPYVCHTDEILCVAYSPDGKHIVSGSWYGTLGLWDVATCKLACAPFIGHKDAVKSVAFSHDGHRIVSGSSDKAVIIWNATNGKIMKGPLTGHTDRVFSVDFSPDGTRVTSASKDGTVIVWDAINGEKISQFRGMDRINAVRFSPDGKLIASASWYNDVILWNAETGEVAPGPFDVEKPKYHIGAPLAFSPDGKCIASWSSRNSIIVQDIENGDIVYELLSTERGSFYNWADVRSIAFSPDGQYIASGMDNGKVLLWNTSSSLTTPRSYEGHSYSITCVAFSPDGSHVVSCSVDNTIRIWNVLDQQDSAAITATDADIALSPSFVDANETSGVADLAGDDGQHFESWIFGCDKYNRWDNWVLSPRGERLLWIPKDMRNTLWRPQNTAVLNCDFSAKLNFKGAALGKRWHECYDPTIELPYPETEATITSPEIETTLTDLASATSQAVRIGDSIPMSIRELRVFAFLHRLVDLLFPLLRPIVDFVYYLLSFVKQ